MFIPSQVMCMSVYPLLSVEVRIRSPESSHDDAIEPPANGQRESIAGREEARASLFHNDTQARYASSVAATTEVRALALSREMTRGGDDPQYGQLIAPTS